MPDHKDLEGLELAFQGFNRCFLMQTVSNLHSSPLKEVTYTHFSDAETQKGRSGLG